MEHLPEKKARGHKCCFTGCNKTKVNSPNTHFFSFPTSRPSVCDQWVTNCANPSLDDVPEKTLRWKVVCGIHFKDDCFTSTMQTRLNKDAVPTVFRVDYDETSDLNESNGRPNDEILHLNRQTNNNEVPLLAAEDENESPICKKSLFSDHGQEFKVSMDPPTPEYKKMKSTKGRKPTPHKKTPITPSKRRILKRLQESSRKVRNLERTVQRMKSKPKKVSTLDIINSIGDYLPEKVASLVKMQLRHYGKQSRWEEHERKQVLSMKFKSNSFYEHMRRDGFVLPSKSTVARWLEKINIRPGVNHEVLSLLEEKVKLMSPWERKAVIMMDEMAIKKNLEYDIKTDSIEGLQDLGEDGRSNKPGTGIVLVMARGLMERWKFPVAYYVVNKTVMSKQIKNIVINVLSAMLKIGLDVKALVCDQGSTNRKTASLLGVNPEQPFFMVDEHKIFWIYDFPHILKCIRNNLSKRSKDGKFVGQIYTDRGTANWQFVHDLFQLEQTSTTARATKLTEKHLNPNSFEKMSVKLAAQIMSHSTTAAMRTAIQCRQLPEVAEETAVFLEGMNNLFDSMNSRSKFDVNGYRCAVSDADHDHLKKPLETIRRGLEWARTWKMKNLAKEKEGKAIKRLNKRKQKNKKQQWRRPPSFDGLLHTLNATVQLWEEMKSDNTVKTKYLLTRRLNQDPLENEFSIFRQRCGYDRNPSATMFRHKLRQRITGALIRPSSGANCEVDNDEVLAVDQPVRTTTSNIETPSTSLNQTIVRDEENCEDSSEESESDLEDADLHLPTPTLESCSVRYFAGYAISRCLKKYKCSDCKAYLTRSAPTISTQAHLDDALITNREYKKFGGALVYPSDEAFKAADVILNVFHSTFPKKIHCQGIKKKIAHRCKQMLNKKVPSFMKCVDSCQLHRQMVLNKLIVAKIRREVLHISKEMRQPHSKNNKHVLKLSNLNP